MAELPFSPDFEACPTQTRRRSSVQSGIIDDEPPADSTRSSKNKGRRGSSSSQRKQQVHTTDWMDGSMGQSGATDVTEEVDNSTTRRHSRKVTEAAAKPLSFVQESNEDRPSASRHRKSADQKVREFNNQNSSVAAARSKDKADHDDLLAEKRRAVSRPGAYTATRNDDAYTREKARLFDEEGSESESEDEVEPTGMEHGNLLNKRALTPAEKKKVKDDKKKANSRKQSSVAPAPNSKKGVESFDEEYDSKSRSKKNSPGKYDDEPQSQVIASHGRVGAPGYEYATTNGGFAGPGFETFHDEGLAIAIAVDEDYYDGENTDFYHHAIEYNPDAKPPLHKNRRFRFYFIILAIVVIVASVGAAVSIVLQGNNAVDDGIVPTAAPSDAPTTQAEGIYRVQFASIVGDVANEPETPQDRAAIWIMYEDQSRLAPAEDRLIQRYILALFYFFTTNNEERTWKSCNRPLFNEEDSCNFMRFNRNPRTDEIYYEPEEGTRWLSKTHECDWVGVQCDETDSVVALELWGQNITGPMPNELKYIPFIQRISLAYNAFTGSIPAEYAEVRHLLDLEVHGNQLTGTIPGDFWKVLTLQNFNVGENQITGTLSTEIGLLTSLKGFHYSENLINGTIPTEIGNLQYLSYTRGDKNLMTGVIPSEIGKLTLLQELWLQENFLSGSIPTEVGNMAEISDFRIARNRIYGTIPDELYNNKSQLTRLDLQNMLLGGTLSTRIGELNNLQSIYLKSNRLTGTVPTELARIKSLRLLWVHLNEFTGPIPLQVCSRTGPGALEFLNADCGPLGAPAQECACCHSCCDRNTELCQLTDDRSS